MKTKRLMPILLILFALAACKEPVAPYEEPLYPLSKLEPVLFQYDFHAASGFRHYGWLLDSLGRVNAYNFEQPEHLWIEPDSAGYITKENLLNNLALSHTIFDSIGIEPVREMARLINRLQDNYTAFQPVLSDSGVAAFYAYKFDESKQMYKRVLISETGKSVRQNMAPEYKTLEQRLIEIGLKNPPFFWITN